MLYLAVADLLFSISHAIDHLYSVLQIEQGFEEFCIFAAFLLEVFGILVFFNRNLLFPLFDSKDGFNPKFLSSELVDGNWLVKLEIKRACFKSISDIFKCTKYLSFNNSNFCLCHCGI